MNYLVNVNCRWRLIPMGSFSKIESTSNNQAYELYDTGEIPIVAVLHRRRFNAGMAGFLDCLKQIMDHVKGEDPSIQFPDYCM